MELGTDKPKSNISEDLLGYKPSADLTAKSIANIQSPDGIVIGIEGQWGSGKTTYINFVRNKLNELSPNQKAIEFKPWLYSGRDELIGAYFRFLNDSAQEIFKDDKAILEAIGGIAEFLTPAIKFGTNFFTGGIGGDLAEGATKNVVSLLQKDTSLETQYSNIRDALEGAKKPFVVVIDDLDRLEAHEIRAMLQLVKTVGQLPYVTYILSYDRAYVETCIDEKLPENHASYLEKIIQLQIALPKPTQHQLLSMLDAKLRPYFNLIEERNDRWRTVAREGVIPYISKPRDVERLLNAMIFAHASVGGSIDIVDLIAMEVLRAFDNALWKWIRDNKDYLFGQGAYNWRVDDKHKKEDFLEAINKLSPLREQQENILSALFPKLLKVFERNQYSGSEPYYKTKNRAGIAVEGVFDLYFSQQVSDNEVTKPDLDNFLDPQRSLEEMKAELRKWIERTDNQGFSKISEFLEHIAYRHLDERTPKPTQNLLDALWDVGDEIVSIDEPPRFLLFGPDNQYRYTVEKLLERLGKEATISYLGEKLNRSHRLSINCFVMHWVALKIGAIPNEHSGRNPLIAVDNWKDLADKLKAPLKQAFEDGSIGEFSSVLSAEFLAAQMWGNNIASNLFAIAYEKSPEYLVKTIKSHLSRTGSGDIMIEYKFSQTENPELFNYPLLADHAKAIIDTVDNQESKKALQVFIDGVEASSANEAQPNASD